MKKRRFKFYLSNLLEFIGISTILLISLLGIGISIVASIIKFYNLLL